MAIHLSRIGFRVYAGVRRDCDGAALRRTGLEQLVPIYLDVTDLGSILVAAQRVATEMGPAGLHALVNNAGIAVAAALEFLPLEELRRQFEVNIVGSVAVTQAFLPHIRCGHGRIVNMGSVGGRLPIPLLGAYCASKAALSALTDSLRVELQPWRIFVSVIEPGVIATPMVDKVRRQADVLLSQIPEEVRGLYEPSIKAVRNAVEKQFATASSPDVVARIVGRVLTANRPKARYVVGRNGRLEAFIAACLPVGIRDALLTWALMRPEK